MLALASSPPHFKRAVGLRAEVPFSGCSTSIFLLVHFLYGYSIMALWSSKGAITLFNLGKKFVSIQKGASRAASNHLPKIAGNENKK